MKRSRETRDEADGTKKRCVEYVTFQKWQHDLDHKYQTMSWLDCNAEKEGAKKVVARLKCKVCAEFVDHISGRKNFSKKWVVRADSV